MSNEQTTSTVPVLSANHLPTVAGGAMVLWLLVEFGFRRGLTPVLAPWLGSELGADAVSSILGFSLATAGIAWWGVRAGITPAEAYGTYVAVITTAMAFVLKHLVVDLSISPFRTTALLVLALGLCGLRARYGTTSSTIVHVLMNSIETALVIFTLG